MAYLKLGHMRFIVAGIYSATYWVIVMVIQYVFLALVGMVVSGSVQYNIFGRSLSAQYQCYVNAIAVINLASVGF